MIDQILFCFASIICSSLGTMSNINVPKWKPYDFSFKSNYSHENPFMVNFYASVKGPNNIEFELPGFYDGNGTWKIRISPTTEGEWSFVTHSDDPELNEKEISFLCVPNNDPNIHGGLLIDKEHPYHFIFEDGTRYFMMGYECDWLWALDINTLEKFLDKIASYGFNNIILNAYAHDTGWCKGKTSEKDYGPPPMYAWEGTNEKPIHDRFNLDYWQHYDKVIESLYKRNITAHIMIKVYNKMVNWPSKGSHEDDMYFRWIISRYSAFPNVIWDFSKEANNEKDLDYKIDRLMFIKKNDPYRRLVTNHDDKAVYDSSAYNKILDFRSDQQHSDWHEKIISHRKQNVWPVVNVEFGYEHGPKGIDDKTYGVVQIPEEVCRRAWEICLAGGYIVYYYTYTAWDVIYPEDTPVGYSYFKNLIYFFSNTKYWLMEPADELVDYGYCLANRGFEYIIFINTPNKIKFKEPNKALKARWFNPFTGKYIDANNKESGEFEPPSEWGNIPMALHLISEY